MTTESPAVPAPPAPLRPVAGSERVDTIDILRGLALFGILAANIRGFSGPPIAYMAPDLFWTALHDRIAQAFIDTFVQGKFITIFAFLFGVGFAVQFERAMERGAAFGWTFARRMFVLLLIGLAHGLLIWFGDILVIYALSGFLLLFFRKRRDKTIAIWALLLFAFMPLMMTGAFIASRSGVTLPNLTPPAAEIARAADVYASGTWLDIQAQRSMDAVKFNWGYFPGLVWHIVSLFLLGILAWRKRFFQPAPESLGRYRTAMWWALAIGVTGNVVGTVVDWIFHLPMMPSTWLGYAMMPVRVISVPALSLGYITLVILVCQDARWRARLHRFGAVGRMALTNYLLQAVIGTLIFYNYGLGLFGLGPAVLLPMTVVLFAGQMIASSWWLARYRFGPVEWLWRLLTYEGPLSMRRDEIAAATEQVPA